MTAFGLTHYTYYIWHEELDYSYYGVRSCVGAPEDDTRYWGSSSDLDKLMRKHPNGWLKSIDGLHPSRIAAERAEADVIDKIIGQAGVVNKHVPVPGAENQYHDVYHRYHVYVGIFVLETSAGGLQVATGINAPAPSVGEATKIREHCGSVAIPDGIYVCLQDTSQHGKHSIHDVFFVPCTDETRPELSRISREVWSDVEAKRTSLDQLAALYFNLKAKYV